MGSAKAAVVYAAGMLQGFAFTLVPSLATVFAKAPYFIDASKFGSLFIPLTLGAIAGAAATPLVATRSSMVNVLRLGLASNLAALLALLAALAAGRTAAYALLLVDTAALGVGFGLNFSSVNELASTLSANETFAVTLANVLTGLGTSLTPLIAARFIDAHALEAWPAILAAAFAGVFAASLAWTRTAPHVLNAKTAPISRTLVYFGVAALLYAFCEGTFSSWATSFAKVRGFTLDEGEFALSAFWLSLTLMRLLAASAGRLLAPALAFVIFPLFIAAAFFVLPLWSTPATFVAGFIFGGVACSIVFPYAMALALGAMPLDKDRVAGVMVAALMIGEGFGTYAVGAMRNAGVSLPQVYRVAAFVALALWIAAMLARRSSPARTLNSSS